MSAVCAVSLRDKKVIMALEFNSSKSGCKTCGNHELKSSPGGWGCVSLEVTPQNRSTCAGASPAFVGDVPTHRGKKLTELVLVGILMDGSVHPFVYNNTRRFCVRFRAETDVTGKILVEGLSRADDCSDGDRTEGCEGSPGSFKLYKEWPTMTDRAGVSRNWAMCGKKL